MKTATNPITGDLIKTKSSTEKYRNNYDEIFRKKESSNEKNTPSNNNDTPSE